MNGKMWEHAATQKNVRELKARGAEFIGPDTGLLSCGYEGVGRLEPVDSIAERALAMLGMRRPDGKRPEKPRSTRRKA
jgi:phosphopantothenoylcysteine synthetase/decarboxylase